MKAGGIIEPEELPFGCDGEKDERDFSITNKATKLSRDRMKKYCFYIEDDLKDIDFRLADMSYYHQRGAKLVSDITTESFIKKKDSIVEEVFNFFLKTSLPKFFFINTLLSLTQM